MNSFLMQRYREILGEDFGRFKKAIMTKSPTYIRVNSLRMGEEELKKRLRKKGIVLKKKMSNCFEIKRARMSPGATIEYLLGYYFLQDWTSLLPVLSLKPKGVVWDMCASPGGKTTHISELMRNKGVLVATDKKRVRALFYNVMRMGCKNVLIYRKDAREINYMFDYILLDAPCTGTGIMRKDRTRMNVKRRDIIYMSNLQKKLVEKAISSLKKGGKMVYSTCSLEPEENEEIVEHAINNGMKVVDSGFGSSGLGSVFGREYNKQVRKSVRIWPYEGNGFFFAKMVKK